MNSKDASASAGGIFLLGIPFDANSSYLRGPASAPPLIRKALHSDSSNLWAEDGTDLGAADIWFDAGDLQLPVNTRQRSSRLKRRCAQPWLPAVP